MADPEQPPPEAHAPKTASWVPAPPFDFAAVEGTAAYTAHPTKSFPGAPAVAEAETATNDSAKPGQSALPPNPDLPNIPGFEIIRVISDGGMGTVFEARHIAMNKIVALKIIKAGWADNDVFRARFKLEVQSQARLEHPNVVPVYDASSWQGLPYMTMKFVAGKTLAAHMPRIRRDPRAVARLMVQVARAVDYLHANGIIHRDLKPLNILMAENDVPLVADFGLVKLREETSDATRLTEGAPGTPPYMSPEQTYADRGHYTAGCDVWALGVILYEFIAGRRPFDDIDPVVLYNRIRSDPPPPIPPEANAPSGLEMIARKCLAKAISDRYATAEAVAADLERWLAGAEIPLLPVVTATSPEPVAVDALPSTAPGLPEAPAQPPPQRRTRRVRWAVAAVALLSLLGFSGIPSEPPRPEEPKPPRTIAERLKAGETVWLVGEKGRPLVPTERVAGWDFNLNTERDGYCTLTCVRSGAMQLYAGPLPRPVVLKAEVALYGEHFVDAWGGVYVCGKQTPAPDGTHMTCVSLAKRTFSRPGPKPVWFANRFVQLIWTRDNTITDRSTLGESAVECPPPKVPPRLEWGEVSCALWPDHVEAVWNETALGTVRDAEALPLLNGVARRVRPINGPQFAGLIDGSGLGVLGFRIDVVVRNVRLVPIK